MDSNNDSPLGTPKKEGILDVSAGLKTELKVGGVEVGVDEKGGGGVSKGADVAGVGPSSTVKPPIKPWDTPGFCRRCHIRMDLVEDGRGGMWLKPGSGRVFVDGCGLCIDCELNNSVETDPNWGRSRTTSGEDTPSSSEEVSSFTPSKKKHAAAAARATAAAV